MLLLCLSNSNLNDAQYIVTCGTTQIRLGLLMECLLKVNYKRHALDIMCERYICRRTPALCPDEKSLNVFGNCLGKMLGTNVAEQTKSVMKGGTASVCT